MSDFQPLQKPQRAVDGTWFIPASRGVVKYLNAESELVRLDVTAFGQELYFDTEYHAYKAACRYYHICEYPYPFMHEYLHCKIPDGEVGSIPQPVEVKSEIMVFE